MRLVCSSSTDLVTSLDKLHIWNSWLEMRSESDGAGFQTLQQLLSESFYTRTSSSLSISLCPRLAFTAARSFAVNIYTWSREKPVFQHTLPVRDVGRYTVLYISTPKNKKPWYQTTTRVELLIIRESIQKMFFSCCRKNASEPTLFGIVSDFVFVSFCNKFRALQRWVAQTRILQITWRWCNSALKKDERERERERKE